MPKPSRTIRACLALIAIASLLFTQLAIAAYACPAQASTTVQVQPAMDHCQDMDAFLPSLCQAYGHANQVSPDHGQQPPVQPFLPSGFVQILSQPAAALPLYSVQEVDALTHPIRPPIAILHCCFRF
jgi:hypothetical protein